MSRLTILVVDDEQPIQRLLKRILEREGYQVVTAGSVAVAEEILAEVHVDAVLCDQMLPGEQGISFLERLAGTQPDLLRVLMTGFGDLQLAKLAINKAKVQHFLSKPFEPGEVLDCLQRQLGKPAAPRDTGRHGSGADIEHLIRLRAAYPGIDAVVRNTQGRIVLEDADMPRAARERTPEVAGAKRPRSNPAKAAARKRPVPGQRVPRQPTVLRELEATYPGISAVERTQTGSILLDEDTCESMVDTSEYKRPTRLMRSAASPRKQADPHLGDITIPLRGSPAQDQLQPPLERRERSAPDRGPFDTDSTLDESLLGLGCRRR